MIQVDTIHIKEVRGLRDVLLKFDRKSFVISGPNGSGKSGVVDAIEFCLTGDISRLTGKGTRSISLTRHGPHVDRRDDPGAAEVTMKIYLPTLDQAVTITRNMRQPKKLQITPDSPSVRSVFAEIESHPEFVLSRREIIRYVLAEAGQRSKEIQALLRLDRIDEIRATLGTVSNRLKTAAERAKRDATDAQDALKRHLDIGSASAENILVAINERRKLLDLPELDTLTAHSQLDAGIQGGARSAFNKESALRDVDALKDQLALVDTTSQDDRDKLLSAIGEIEADPGLLKLVQQESFLQSGLDLIDSAICPLCDYEWPDQETLRRHIEEKLALSSAAGRRRREILVSAEALAGSVRSLRALILPVAKLARDEGAQSAHDDLKAWSEDLDAFALDLATTEGVIKSKERLSGDWANVPSAVASEVGTLRSAVESKPDQSAAANAQTFLALAQDRFASYRRARQQGTAADTARASAKSVLDAYNKVSEECLTEMYNSVEEDFSEFYRDLNAGDEVGFRASFEQGAGKLDLNVDFYGLGMFPPGAYHSEGHQDGMGVCLYLALMRRLLGDQFRFAVLDDVVMSIDSGHRKQFCKLLKTKFPGTQLVITTHDEIWARQMRSAGLIDRDSNVEFQGWNVATGPAFEPVAEVWDRIDTDLARNDVPTAAARLRRHLEYTSKELADLLGAPVVFKGDASYELGDLFDAVVSRHGTLLKEAAAAANSWNNAEDKAQAEKLKEERRKAIAAYGDEAWVVNKAVHFNDWASFSKADFEPVVKSVRALLEQWQCSACGHWLYPSPKRNPEAYRCHCGAVNLNLKRK